MKMKCKVPGTRNEVLAFFNASPLPCIVAGYDVTTNDAERRTVPRTAAVPAFVSNR